MKKLFVIFVLVMGVSKITFAQMQAIKPVEGKTYLFPSDSDVKYISVEIKNGKPVVTQLKKGIVSGNFGVEILGNCSLKKSGDKNYITTKGQMVYYPYNGSAPISLNRLSWWRCENDCKDGQNGGCEPSACIGQCCLMCGGYGDEPKSTLRFGGGGGITIIVDDF
ncbi:MAG: hypothetical protein U0X91_21440 [Spirosomataceae bacterium]